jgi:uncharacterized protein
MKTNLLVTRECNLRCSYCYIGKRTETMPLATGKKAVDFIFEHTPGSEKIHIGFFGGEPLLAFDRIRDITAYIEDHPKFDPNRVELAIVTNGTVFSDAIVRFVGDHGIRLGISCDGPPAIHDRFRRTLGGGGSSARVVRTIRLAVEALDGVLVNAVFHPETFKALPETVTFLSELGVRHIYLNTDYSAHWAPDQTLQLADVYDRVADNYVRFYRRGDPHFISLIDTKIIVILRNGYAPEERCRMGKGELAFTPDGGIYPCERLVGVTDNRHRIGHLDRGLDPERGTCRPASILNTPCLTCGIRNYCMNWCGCSNFFATGHYNQVNAFICESEKAALRAAFKAYTALESRLSDSFFDHVHGHPRPQPNVPTKACGHAG